MPVYEYQCKKCTEKFEVMQKINDAPLSKCSSCGGELKKLITNTSFVLKGSGWYVTDYPSADRKKAMDAKKPAEASTDGKKAVDDKKPADSSTKKEDTKSDNNTGTKKKTVNA